MRQSSKTIIDALRNRRTYFDGGYGSLFQSRGLRPGTPPELLNIENSRLVTEAHHEYAIAGCDFITTNTFGVNSIKYDNYEEIITNAIKAAEEGIKGTDANIVFDVGPLGKLLKPLGDLDFEDAVGIFYNTIRFAVGFESVGAILIETMNDSYETKAAVIAAKEASDLPVFVTNAYDSTGKLMTGASPAAMVALLEGLRVDALGINCSLGPDLMFPIVDEIIRCSSLPVIVNPNAGLPAFVEGRTIYNIGPDEFSDKMVEIAKKGVNTLGGCCGTTPDYIAKVIEKTNQIPFSEITEKDITVVSSYTHTVTIDREPVIIGERINPTGKPRLKEALKNNDYTMIIDEASRQVECGADILDVNTGIPEINEKETMVSVVTEIQKITDVPLQIDSSNPEAIEAAMRIYNGKPLINSVNGKNDVMETVFPLIKKYGGSVIALTLDENGIPDSVEKRVEIAHRIVEKASEYGISQKDIIIDPLAMTISSNHLNATITIDTIKTLHIEGFHTVLGVSNISFGLPRRDIVNSTFFISALESGLSCAIINPFDERMIQSLISYKLLHGWDTSCVGYLSYVSECSDKSDHPNDSIVTLSHAVIKGMKESAKMAAKELVKNNDPIKIINEEIVPALNTIGESYEAGKTYLPQLLMSADAAQGAIEVLKRMIPKGISKLKGDVILATVKGDIHDIGKNIVKVLLESYGFNVFDLGKDVSAEKVLECVKSSGCKIVGLSALMTTTVASMEETIALLHSFDPDIRVCVGGAVMNQEYADSINADKYCRDAMDTVKYVTEYYS